MVDIVISEFLSGNVKYSLITKVLQDGITDGLNQMSLTQTGTTVDKDRVVFLAGFLSSGLGGGIGQLIT